MWYRYLVQILDPFVILLTLASLAALILLWRAERKKRLLWVVIPLTLLYLLSTPLGSHYLIGILEWRYPPNDAVAPRPAIVVLGGGVYPPDEIRRKAEPNESTYLRCLRAVESYQKGRPRPVVVCGGKVNPDRPGPTTAEVMRELLTQLGVNGDDVWLQNQSTTTYEDALYSAEILRKENIRSVTLITEASHLERGVRCFEAQGLTVQPVGCRYRATRLRWSIMTVLPSTMALDASKDACHEFLGLMWYKLRGRI